MISGATEQELEIANARAELLLEIKDKDKEIGILKLSSQHLVKYNDELENIIKEIREYIDNLKPLTIVETSIKEQLKSAYNPKETSIKGTDKYFNALCHLEDFEIAIWNIKEILDKEKECKEQVTSQN